MPHRRRLLAEQVINQPRFVTVRTTAARDYVLDFFGRQSFLSQLVFFGLDVEEQPPFGELLRIREFEQFIARLSEPQREL